MGFGVVACMKKKKKEVVPSMGVVPNLRNIYDVLCECVCVWIRSKCAMSLLVALWADGRV